MMERRRASVHSDPAQGEVSAIGWGGTLALFGGAALLLLLATEVLIPALAEWTGIEVVVAWFIVGGLAVFAPILVVGALLLRAERRGGRRGPDAPSLWRDRLRFRRMDRSDWLWALGGLAAIGVATGAIQGLLILFRGEVDLHPTFMAFEPLGPGRYWILAAWLPFWVVNILGEEVVWRGVVLPAQEHALGRAAWLANGAGWFLFHLAFGWELMLVLLPICLILPWIAQRTRNSWVAVILHGGLNGPAFVAVALGVVGG